MNIKLNRLISISLLIITIIPISAIAGDEQNPEIEDKQGDMFKQIDMVSIWFFEDINNPDYLYLSFKMKDLVTNTHIFEAIYAVHWKFYENYYAASLNVLPSHISNFLTGRANDKCNDYESYVICNGTYNVDNSIITWEILKDAIGNPKPGDTLIKIFPNTHLRFSMSKFFPRADLFKDLAWNALFRKDYSIQY